MANLNFLAAETSNVSVWPRCHDVPEGLCWTSRSIAAEPLETPCMEGQRRLDGTSPMRCKKQRPGSG